MNNKSIEDKVIEEFDEIFSLTEDLVSNGAIINKIDFKNTLKGFISQAIKSAKKEAVEECIKKIDDYGDKIVREGAEEQSDYYMGELNAVSRIKELLK